MHLSEILIILGAYALVGTHLFIMDRWLRDDTKTHAVAREPLRNVRRAPGSWKGSHDLPTHSLR